MMTPAGPIPVRRTVLTGLILTSLAASMSPPARAAEPAAPTQPASAPADRPLPPPVDPDVLSPQQFMQVQRAIDRALAWLAIEQQPDGSWPTNPRGQPAVTALCLLAFMSRGHLPSEGRYGPALEKAVQAILACQHPDGLIACEHPRLAPGLPPAQAASYNHAIGGLALAECYGMTREPLSRRIGLALRSALALALTRYPAPKRNSQDTGGWRYQQRHQDSDSDLSVTAWHLMFLRSCRNAGLNVPARVIDEATAFVERCFDPKNHCFWYALRGPEHVHTRAMTGAGILSLSLAGRHHTEPARLAGDRLLRFPFDRYNTAIETTDRFFYGAFYCSHAMFQLGGPHFSAFYPTLARTLIAHQRPEGCWDPEQRDSEFGNAYSTALAVLALSPPYQLLPIFQR